MISISSRGSAAEATKYYEHLASDYGPADYYSAESAGHFSGAGIEGLGIDYGSAVDTAAFVALAEGRHPGTGEDLVQKAGEKHRAGWDVTLSPPKSVSTIWALADAESREQIEAAHELAVTRTLAYLAGNAAYTRRGGGWKSAAERREQVDGFVVAEYRHGTSREADPQLHSHLMIFNLAARADGTYGSIEARHIYQHQSAAGALYDATLAHEMQSLGYAVEREGRSFEVAGVPQELRDEFSTRRAQIKEELERTGGAGSHASERATLATRRAKEVENIDVLREKWAERARERAPEWAPESARGIEQPVLDAVPEPADVLRNLTEQRSTFCIRDVVAAVGIAGIGVIDADAVERYATEVLSDPETVELTGRDGMPRYTTREMQAIERGMVERAERMSQSQTHGVERSKLDAALAARPTLSAEQRAAVEHITAPGSVALIQGSAGAGKSYALGAASDAWESQGYRVRGAALAGKAAAELLSGSGIESGTLHQLLRDTRPETVRGVEYAARDPLRAGDVIVLDEAGMVGSRQTADLLARADAAGAKVVMVGDTRQLQAIEAGAAFRSVQERVGYTSIDDIRRQRSDADRQAVRDLRDGLAGAALANLGARGRVHAYETSDAAVNGLGRAVAADIGAGKTSVSIVGTRAEARAVNSVARAAAIEVGIVGGDFITVETDSGLREFAPGDRILALKNDRDLCIKNGDFGAVIRAASGRLTIRLDRDGTERVIDVGKYAHLAHGYAATAHKLQGSTIDRAHVLASDSPLSSREWAYVAGSRHREEVHIHGSKLSISELAKTWEVEKQKDTSLDYDYVPPPAPAPAPAPGREQEINAELAEFWL